MGKPAVSLRNKLIALLAAGLIACGFLPFTAFAADVESVAGLLVGPEGKDDARSASQTSVILSDDAVGVGVEGSILASTLTSDGVSIVSADVVLDGDVSEPVIGSFTVDGLTFALNDNGGVTLMAVLPNSVGATFDAERSAASPFRDVVAPYENPADSGDGSAITIPSTVSYTDVTYDITAIGPYAFYLSGATQVSLPASITSVDDRAFRSSDVAWVGVDADNPNIASFDGALYDASLTSLLLIPEGRAGAVLLPCETEVAEPSKFSHCSLVEAISVEEGGAAFASWDGLLYDASGMMLLRVPAGATEITIREGCTTIAAGAMEGCAKLERINAPASVTSISPNVFESIPTVSLPAIALQDESVGAGFVPAQSEGSAEGATPGSVILSGEAERSGASAEVEGSPAQLTAMVVLQDTAHGVDASAIEVVVSGIADMAAWQDAGFSIAQIPIASLEDASTYAATTGTIVQYLPSGYYFSGQNFTGRANPTTSTWGDGESLSSYWYTNKTTDRVVTLARTYCGTYVNGYWNSTANHGNHYIYSSATKEMASGSWYAEATYENKVTESHIASQTIPTAAYFKPDEFLVTWYGEGGTFADGGEGPIFNAISITYQDQAPVISRPGHRLLGWATEKDGVVVLAPGQVTGPIKNDTDYYAVWECTDIDISFDTSSEPADESYPGKGKDPQTVVGEVIGSGIQVAIEDPKRPGYVFQGWVIPDAETGNKEALDQDLVYQGDDGKWYVDASKLPDYATDGKVELTARWTSIVSADVPSAVTFYADTVTQGQESREGAASSAFGQSKIESRSEVDLCVVGLESSAVETTDTMLGADSILKKASAATPATSAQKLLSLYPSAKAWTAAELQDPSAVGGDKAANAVDFDLNDLLLEASFSAEDFTIPAGDTLNLGYRLNLEESGHELDYDALSTLEDGQSAAIANISYCFSADPTPAAWDEPLWVKNVDPALGRVGYYLLDDIKEAAEDLSAHGEDSEYYALYKGLLDSQITNNGEPGPGPYFQLRINGVYWDLQLIGICQDTKTADGKKAGLTFQLRDIYSYGNKIGYPGSGSFNSAMNATDSNSGGWAATSQRSRLRASFYGSLDAAMQVAIAPVTKFQQYPGGTSASYLQKTTNETIWLPSMYEMSGSASHKNTSEGLKTVAGYVPFQYMAYQTGGTGTASTSASKKYYTSATASSNSGWWCRSAASDSVYAFCAMSSLTPSVYHVGYASNSFGVAPAFCL